MKYKRRSKTRITDVSLPSDCGSEQDLEPFFRRLKNLTNDELRGLLKEHGNEFIDDTIMNLPKVKNLGQSRTTLLEEVANLSQVVLAREPKFVRDRYNLCAEIESTKPIRKILEIKCKQVKDIMQSLEESCKKLSEVTIKSEEESEAISNLFLEGKITNDEFIKKYVDKRKLVHSRRAKSDRLRAAIPKLPEIDFRSCHSQSSEDEEQEHDADAIFNLNLDLSGIDEDLKSKSNIRKEDNENEDKICRTKLKVLNESVLDTSL